MIKMKAILTVSMFLLLCQTVGLPQEQKPTQEQAKKLTKEDVEKLFKNLSSGNDQEAGFSAMAIAQLEQMGLLKEFDDTVKAHIKDVKQLLHSEKRDLVISAIAVLGAMGKEYTKDIAPFLNNSDPTTRQFAIEALAEIGDKEYIKEIAEHLKDGSNEVVASAALALAKLGAKEYTKDIASLLDSNKYIPELKKTVPMVLAQLGAKEYADKIAKLLSEDDYDVKKNALKALEILGAKEYAREVAKLLSDSYVGARRCSIETLEVFGAKEFAQEIARLLNDKGYDRIWNPEKGDCDIIYIKDVAERVLKKWGFDIETMRKQALSLKPSDKVTKLAEQLKSNNEDARCSAVLALQELGSQGAKEYTKDIAELLNDSNWGIRSNSAMALAKLDAKEYAKDIANLLKDENYDARIAGIGALGLLKAKEYSKDILDAMKQKYDYYRSEDIVATAARALSKMGTKELAKEIAELLDNDDANVVANAIQLLGDFDAKEYAGKIAASLNDTASVTIYQTDENSYAAYYVNGVAEKILKKWNIDIGKIAKPDTDKNPVAKRAEKLLPQLKDNDAKVRINALRTIRECGDGKYAKDIIPLLADTDEEVRREAASALAFLYEPYSQILSSLSDNDKDVREAAANALAPLAYKDIIQLLKDDRSYVRASVIWALYEIKAKDCAKDVATLLTDKSPEVQANAALFLGCCGAKEYTKDIAELLKSNGNDRMVKIRALEALKYLKAKEYAKEIVPFLKDEDRQVVIDAEEAITSMGDKSIAKEIIPLLTDKNWKVRWEGVMTLWSLKATEYASEIAKMLDDEDKSIRETAAHALKEWNIDPEKAKQKK